MNPDYFEVRLNRLLIFCWILKWKHNGCKAMKSYIDTVDDIKVTAITGLTNSNGINWGWLKISLKFIWASLFKLDLRLFNHFLQSIFHDFMVAEVVAELIVSRLVYQHIRRNTVNFELFAKVLPLLVVQAEMFSFDVWNRLFVSDERRRFVGQVNPYQVK